MKINNVLKSLFEVIKKKELASLNEEVGQSMADAYSRLGSLLSSDFSCNINKLWHKYIKATVDKVINELKTKKLNKYITKDNNFFIDEVNNCINDIFEIISSSIETTGIHGEELETLIGQKSEKLNILKNDIIMQWNIEAEIIKNKKQNPIQKILENKIIRGIIITVLGGIVLAIILKTFQLS